MALSMVAAALVLAKSLKDLLLDSSPGVEVVINNSPSNSEQLGSVAVILGMSVQKIHGNLQLARQETAHSLQRVNERINRRADETAALRNETLALGKRIDKRRDEIQALREEVEQLKRRMARYEGGA